MEGVGDEDGVQGCITLNLTSHFSRSNFPVFGHVLARMEAKASTELILPLTQENIVRIVNGSLRAAMDLLALVVGHVRKLEATNHKSLE